MKTLHPEYTEKVAFYVVGSGPTQTVERLEKDRQQQGYPWPVAEIAGSGLQDLRVFSQSTKIAIDGDGVITYRDSFGQGNVDKWQGALEDLASSLPDRRPATISGGYREMGE